MKDEAVRLRLLDLAYQIILNRNPTAIITSEKVVEEARKLEAFVERMPVRKKPKAEFLTE